METYTVHLSKRETAVVQIKAESAEEAEDIAFERFIHGEIELEDSGIPGEVDIVVEQPPAPAGDSISIFWDDLTPAKQAEILAAFGDNCNYDVFPITEIPISEEGLE